MSLIEEGQKIARKLGGEVIYKGPWLPDGPEGEFLGHLFTDRVTGSTFAAKTLEEAKATLIQSRKGWGAKPPVFPNIPVVEESKMPEEKRRISPALIIPIGLGLAAAVTGVGVWLWSRREFIEPRPAIDTILRETIAEEGQPVTEAEIEATLIQAGYSEVEAAAVARRIEGDIIEDAAKALYGVNPLDPLTPGDLALAEGARETILAANYNMDEYGRYVSSIPLEGESTHEFSARAKREKEAYRIYQMSQSEYYRAKWGLEPLAEEEEAVIPTEEVVTTPLEPMVILAAQGEIKESVDAGFTATVDQLEQLESQVGRGDTYEAAVDTAYERTASKAAETTAKTGVDTVVAWSSSKGYYTVDKSETYGWR